MSEYVGLTTRSRSNNLKLIPKSSSQRTFADENAYTHPNKRINLASSAEFKASKKNVVKDAEFLKFEESVIKIPAVVIETKKMLISVDEMSMNGAPAGDLYDVQVLNDSQLTSFESTMTAQKSLETAFALNKESSSWADMFTAVEVIRRVTLYHPEIISTSEMLPIALKASIDATSSLRSSTIRNGVACLRSLASLDLEPDSIRQIIETLMSRLSSGPKFICDEANRVLDGLIRKFPPLLCIEGVSNSTNNRNNDISSKAFIIISECVIRLLSISNMSTPKSDNSTEITSKYEDILRLLSRGLSARSPMAREVSKNALIIFKSHLGYEIFGIKLSKALNETAVREVQRELAVDVKNVIVAERPTFKMRQVLTSTSVRPLNLFSTPSTVKRINQNPISSMSTSTSAPRISMKDRMMQQKGRQGQEKEHEQQKQLNRFLSPIKSNEITNNRTCGSASVVNVTSVASDNPFLAVDI